MTKNNPGEWFALCNVCGGEYIYIAARLRDKDEIMHSGNIETRGQYSSNKAEVEADVKRLNEEEAYGKDG